MKFEQQKPEFRPVTITLENQAEVDVLHALLGVAPGTHADNFIWKLYQCLGQMSDAESESYWSGRLYRV